MEKYYLYIALAKFNIAVAEMVQSSFLVRVYYHRWLGYSHLEAVKRALTDLKLLSVQTAKPVLAVKKKGIKIRS